MEAYANRLSQTINSGVLNFQTFICQTYLEPHSSKVLADYISADFQPNLKLLAVTGVNLLNKQRLRLNPKDIDQFWNEFKIDFLLNDCLQWKHVNLLIKSLQVYKVQFGENFNKYFVQIFEVLSFKWKIVLYKCLIQNEQMSLQVYYVFFRQTIQKFLFEGNNFIFNNHQHYTNVSHQEMLIQNNFLQTFSQVLDFIQIQQEQKFIKLKQKLLQKQQIWQIAAEELLFNPVENFKNLKQESFNIQNINLRYFKGQDFQLINQNKMNALNIFHTCIKQFNVYSTAQEFDNSKFLLTLQHLIPKLLQQLLQIATQKNFDSTVQKFQGTIQSMFIFLSTASKFIFLLQIFKNFQQNILYILFPTFLKADTEQIQKYDQQPKQFIQLNRIIFEDDLQKISRINTVKEACSLFFRKYLMAIKESTLELVYVLLDTIQFKVQNKQMQQKLKNIFDIGFNPNLQVCIQILSLIFIQSQKRQSQLHHLILDNFIFRQFHLRFEGLDKARFICFLLYCFEFYFQKRITDGVKIIEFVYSSMVSTKDKTLFLYTLQFMEQRIVKIDSEIMKIIWQKIVNQIKTTQHYQLISIVKRIVRQKLSQMSIHTVQNLLQIVFIRINSEYQRQIDAKGTHILFKSLEIIQQISQNISYISKQSKVIQLIWPLFQFLKRHQRIQYEDNIIQIFNYLLIAQENINLKYYQFLPYFEKITQTHKIYGKLLQTYFLLISKGQNLFLSALSENIDLCNAIRFNIQINIFQNRTLNYAPSYVLLQFLLISYPHLVKQNPDFYNKTLQLYNNTNNSSQKTQNLTAAIVNYLIAYHISFGIGDISIIQQNNIYIFKGCFGKLFAINLVKLIQKYAETDFVVNFLKFSLRLLHFLKQYTSKEIQKNNQTVFYTISSKYIVLDPFLIIQESFVQLKNKIGRQNFQQCMRLLQEQLPKDYVKILFMYKQVNNTKRQIAKVKKFD